MTLSNGTPLYGQVVARMEYHRFVHRRSWRLVQLSDAVRRVLCCRKMRRGYTPSEKVRGPTDCGRPLLSNARRTGSASPAKITSPPFVSAGLYYGLPLHALSVPCRGV